MRDIGHNMIYTNTNTVLQIITLSNKAAFSAFSSLLASLFISFLGVDIIFSLEDMETEYSRKRRYNTDYHITKDLPFNMTMQNSIKNELKAKDVYLSGFFITLIITTLA